MRHFLEAFPIEIWNVNKNNHTQAKDNIDFRTIALVRRQGGYNAAIRKAWEDHVKVYSVINIHSFVG